MTGTKPVSDFMRQTAPEVVIAATYKDESTDAVYVHKDLLQVQAPWAEEAHISPMKAMERFGDVESWVAYVKRYADTDAPGTTFLTWNSLGLSATLDYADIAGNAGRCQWKADQPFERSVQWKAWMALANGQPIQQRGAVEKLEDLGPDIIEPAPADLANLLRTLRASVKATADTELRPDGSSKVSFSQDKSVKSGEVELPPTFTIAIPVLKGHVDAEGRPVLYRLQVRVRVSVDDNAHLAFRFTIPTAERTLEDVYADRVQAASALLGDGFQLLRAAG